MSYTRNDLTLYLRPIEYQPPYRITDLAQWLVRTRQKKDINQATNYIIFLQYNHPPAYKLLLSRYYFAVDYRSTHLNRIPINSYISAKGKTYYGEDAHMWY
jgi:hypothetical protein